MVEVRRCKGDFWVLRTAGTAWRPIGCRQRCAWCFVRATRTAEQYFSPARRHLPHFL